MDRRMAEEIVIYWMAPKTEEHWYYTNRPDEHLRFSKLFDAELLPFDIELNVYGDKTAFIILDEGDLGGMIIENESVANSMRALCRFVWKAL